ncbi:hypothetical protein [Stenotrophomonas sp. PD6]|uniref:hypothetical protein n=1 Tax=Stenotrophomonas sp. PD6 TaxID=3368612 RepID=UPI003B9F47A2
MKSFPEQALAHAHGGVIAPSALGLAARAGQLESHARQRAAEVMASVPPQVDAAIGQARLDGFQQGYAEAVGVAVPLLAAALADVQALREAVLGQVREVVTASLAAEGVDAALVVRRCEQALGNTDGALVLYVPETTPTLGEAVLAQLTCQSPPLQVVSARSPLPMLKAGPLLFELDPAGAISAAVEASVDAAALEAAARQRAEAYLRGMNTQLKRLPFPDASTGVER